MIFNFSSQKLPIEDIEIRMAGVNQAGSAAAFSEANAVDCVVSLGCYKAKIDNPPPPFDVTTIPGDIFDPSDCFALCSTFKVNYDGVSFFV
jgi:hypothetical protein